MGGSKKKPWVAKKKLHNRFRESFESSLSRNSFQHWLFTCIRFSISIYNAASVYPAIRTRSPRAENGFSGCGRAAGGARMVGSLRRGVDLHRVPVLTDRSCGCAEICIPPRDAFYWNARLAGWVSSPLFCFVASRWLSGQRNEFFGYCPWLEC